MLHSDEQGCNFHPFPVGKDYIKTALQNIATVLQKADEFHSCGEQFPLTMH